MSKKLPQVLLIPTLGLLPLTQAIAMPSHHAMEASSHVAEGRMPERPLLGKMLRSKTIQLQMSGEDIANQYPSDKTHIITLMTAEGKQRFVLLTQARSELVRALAKAHGRIAEFDFYSVQDADGNDLPLFASKRIVTAPANQLTLVFPTAADKKSFFTKENQAMIANANIFMLTAESAKLATNEQLAMTQQIVNAEKGMDSTESKEYSQEINQINNTVSAKAKDNSKSNITETIHMFPAAVAQAMNQVAQVQDQKYQAQSQQEQATAQVQQETVSTMQQGVSQTEQVANQLRQNAESIAQDESSMVSSTRV